MSDTTYTHILVETHQRAGLIRLNRPKALNALNTDLMREVVHAAQTFDAADAVGAIVITGSDRAFAAGADIKEMAAANAVDMLVRDNIGIWDQLLTIKKPLIAAVSGWALGGGCELAMLCDILIASESARFGQPEINLGVIPGAGGTQRLVHAVGKSLAMEMVLADRQLSAQEALAYGLASRVLPVETYLQDALELANKIAQNAPLAVRLGKEAINNAFQMPLRDGLAAERRAFYFLFASDDQTEGMQAFIEKRPAQWKGQ